MTRRFRFGICTDQNMTWEKTVERWRLFERLGYESAWLCDHLVQPSRPQGPYFEAWSLLGGLAAVTKTMRVGVLVTSNTFRYPQVLAKMAVTVDHLSGGRLEFGIGAGWAEIEHTMYGIEGLDHRVGRLSESLQVIKSLWTQGRTNFEGRYYKLTDAIANPKPLQKPHPPIWIGASGATTLRLVARHADVWNIAGGEPDKVEELTAMLEEACGAVGRDPSKIRRSIQFGWDGADRGHLLELCGRFLAMGVTEQVIYLRGGQPVALAAKVAEALPDLRKLDRVARQ